MWKESDWEFARTRDEAGSMMWVDGIHVEAIYRICQACDFKTVLEIGCWDGFTTSAFVQARRDGKDFLLTVCDLHIRDRLIHVLRQCPVGWRAWQDRSTSVLSRIDSCDLVMIDGDHALATVQAELRIVLERGFKTIIAHDVGSRGGCDGPGWMAETLRRDPRFKVMVDEKAREGMATHRGLMLATMDSDVWIKAHEVFEQ